MNSLSGIVFVTLVARVQASHGFNYNDQSAYGPGNWSAFRNWTSCGSRERQSPIDIMTARNSRTVSTRLELKNYDQKVSGIIENNGHTVKISSRQFKSVPTLTDTETGEVYSFVQVHFHWPSEHTINGRDFKLEGHFVHSTDGGTAFAVISVLYDAMDPVHPNPHSLHRQSTAIETLSGMLPQLVESGSARDLRFFNLANLLPDETSNFYTYEGSLTTPPCTEAVQWFLMAKPLKIRTAVIKHLVEGLSRMKSAENDVIRTNNRPIQTNEGYAVTEHRGHTAQHGEHTEHSGSE